MLDGCTDNSEEVVTKYLKNSDITHTIVHTDNIYENRRLNNVGLKFAQGKYAIIVQDDQLITEKGWNTRLHKPFEVFDDVFAVTQGQHTTWSSTPTPDTWVRKRIVMTVGVIS